MKFYNKHDEDEYNGYLDRYNEMLNSKRFDPKKFKKYDWIEICECDDIKCFHHPQSIVWWRFYGTWEELHDKLQKDFPYTFPDVKFYTEASIPGIII